MKRLSLKSKVATKISRSNREVFLRSDFEKLAGYDQVGRALRQLTSDGVLVKVGYGLYAKARPNRITGKPMLSAKGGFTQVAEEALSRLGEMKDEIGDTTIEIKINKDKGTLHISDKGIGMTAETRANLGSAYFQADDGPDTSHHGCGLGLAIVQELLGRMEGALSIESELGKGSTFTVLLPVTQEASKEEQPESLLTQGQLQPFAEKAAFSSADRDGSLYRSASSWSCCNMTASASS